VKNRLKSVLRSRGVGYGAGRSVYAKRDRERWLGELPEATRPLAELLYEEHDGLMALKAKAEKAVLTEARRHREWRLLKTCPGSRPDPDGRAAAGGGQAVPVPEPESLLGVLGARDRDA
jgi:transposase